MNWFLVDFDCLICAKHLVFYSLLETVEAKIYDFEDTSKFDLSCYVPWASYLTSLGFGVFSSNEDGNSYCIVFLRVLYFNNKYKLPSTVPRKKANKC